MNTKNNLPIEFKYDSQSVRTLTIENQPWFVGKDVCDILEYGNYRDALSKLDDDERRVSEFPTPSGIQKMTVINQSGLYALILRSNKPEAKIFRKWITSEVIPSLRKTGSYTMPNANEIEMPSEEYNLNTIDSQLEKWNVKYTELVEESFETHWQRVESCLKYNAYQNKETLLVRQLQRLTDIITKNNSGDFSGMMPTGTPTAVDAELKIMIKEKTQLTKEIPVKKPALQLPDNIFPEHFLDFANRIKTNEYIPSRSLYIDFMKESGYRECLFTINRFAQLLTKFCKCKGYNLYRTTQLDPTIKTRRGVRVYYIAEPARQLAS